MTPRAVPVSVPGKLFVLGEYAILAGGPALVTTVDRHIRVRPRDKSDGYQVEGADLDDPLHLPMLIRRVLDTDEDIEIDANALTVDVGEFFHEETKLGFGSSAASTVAIVASTAPHLSAKRRFELAFDIHRRLQDGAGSGADIAASIFGGPLAYRLASPQSPFDDIDLETDGTVRDEIETEIATIDKSPSFPPELRIDAVWTGQRASSVSFIDGVVDAMDRKPGEIAAKFTAIAEAARAGIRACRDGDADAFVDAVRAGDLGMEELGAATNLPIITDAHRRIRALAHTTHSVAKPSGAGGGDFTLLVGPANAPVPRPIEDQYRVISVA